MYKVGLLTILIIFLLIAGFCQIHKNDIFIEFYITPRSVNYGFGDKGIFKFSMNQKSIRVPYSKRSYMTTTRVDSVYELYYFKDTVDKSFSEIFNIDTTAIVNDDFLYPRILILVHQESNIDTFAINKNFSIMHHCSIYGENYQLKKYLIDKMPDDIKANWIYKMSPR